MELYIIGFGPVAGYKYSRCIHDAVQNGYLQRYHVIDRESQQQVVEGRLSKLPLQPASCTYIPDHVLQHGTDAGIEWLDQQQIFARSEWRKIKVVICTEPQTHEAYIRYALGRQFDVLVTKPMVLPMKNGIFDYEGLLPNVDAMAKLATDAGVNTGMICLGRLHEIYETKLRQPMALMVDRLQSPITSVHVKTASGVWNLASEFFSRDDHPYKFGYGMLMHGAYHYIDVLAGLLLLNRKLFPDDDLVLTLKGFSAGPYDQQSRIGKLDRRTAGYQQELSELKEGVPYGETDIVASYALKFRATGKVLTLGTIGLEQTTPGMRSWGPFPEVPYNVNGRLHCTDIDARIGTAFSINANVTKHPIQARMGDSDIRGVNSGTVVTRSNARLTQTQGFIRHETFERPYGNSYSYSAEAELFEGWVLGKPSQSDFASHVPSCAILAGLLKLAANDWSGDVEMDFNYPAPDRPASSVEYDPWYDYMSNTSITFSSEN